MTGFQPASCPGPTPGPTPGPEIPDVCTIDYTLPLHQLPDPLPIKSLQGPFNVTMNPPGSKSITNRAYILAALAQGQSKIRSPLRAEDTDSLLSALQTLGVQTQWQGPDVFITGVNGRFPRGGAVNLGDGGTPTRFILAAACLAAKPVVIDGSPRMRQRPIAEGVDMLRKLGATIDYLQTPGQLPVQVTPSNNFTGGQLTIGKTASSQFISALMLIAPWLTRGIKLHLTDHPTSQTYIDLTYAVMGDWNITIATDPPTRPRTLHIKPQMVPGTDFPVQPDASSAVYWLMAAAINPHSTVCIPYLTAQSMQPDIALLDVLKPMGAILQSDLDGTTLTGSNRIAAQSFSGEAMPDGVLAYAAAAALADGTSTITGLHTLRVKETDRIAALANELRRVGCNVQTTADSLAITPHQHPAQPTHQPVTIETYNDHRMAMSFAILGLARPGISIANPKCVAKSYPTFWQHFASLHGPLAKPHICSC